ncbi:EAL domain-containing protein (putative c-di-GMP-specific phosphodiesterase class I) [Deinococcus sp. HSC-46F16]|uniref:EAL domain-containing protein n=1 Tax=Deinococcus sp. HSC-46F16 TaxID=2910968 RepID=UPI00209E5687|nr:EAL domain-containing protein (putative c-di-GMP-specific phosphodiesterase class I) [Deinococcus sp. HSC-46F16]
MITAEAGSAAGGLYLHAASQHVRRRLSAWLAALGLSHERRPEGPLVTADAFGTLPALLDMFSPTERADLFAAPCRTDGSPDAWQMAPLERWVQRLDSGWFFGASERLRFHLQPIVALRGGEVYGYEALVRAEGEGGAGLIGAGPLLQAACTHGQARAFDAQARRGAIRQIYPQLAPGQVLFINFAPGVVYNPDVCLQTTFQTCREVGADFSRLLFEVTESEAFPDLGLLRRILDRYRAEGAQVALDDLGAGHTSLTYLAELRPDVVKLDRALISGLHGSDRRTPLVLALVEYAHDLGIRVVAEGIETETELRLVRELGADYAQGYFLGRPAPLPAGVTPDAARVWEKG